MRVSLVFIMVLFLPHILGAHQEKVLADFGRYYAFRPSSDDSPTTGVLTIRFGSEPICVSHGYDMYCVRSATIWVLEDGCGHARNQGGSSIEVDVRTAIESSGFDPTRLDRHDRDVHALASTVRAEPCVQDLRASEAAMTALNERLGCSCVLGIYLEYDEPFACFDSIQVLW